MTRRARRSATPAVCGCRYRHEHGTRRMYVTHRCGCFHCRVAHARSVQSTRTGGRTAEDRYVDATGTRRRIEALSAAGFPHTVVASHLAVSKESVGYFRIARRVHVATAHRIADVYDTLTALPPPTGWLSDRTRRASADRGWVPPLAWDDETIDDPSAEPATGDHSTEMDEVAVERIMGGTLHLPLNSQMPERREAIRRLAARGFTDREIGDRVGLTGDAVCATRIRHNIPSGLVVAA